MSYQVKRLALPVSDIAKTEIKQLWAKHGVENPEQRFRWLFETSYAKSHICTVIVLSESSIVGFASLLIKSDYSIGVPINFIIDKLHRTLGPALMLQKEIVRLGSEMPEVHALQAYPNKDSAIIFKRIGFRKVKQSCRFVYLINPLPYFCARLGLGESQKFISHLSIMPRLVLSLVNYIKIGSYNLKTFHCAPDSISYPKDYTEICSLLTDYEKWRYVDCPLTKFCYAKVSFKDKPLSVLIIYSVEKGVLSIENINQHDSICIKNVLTFFLNNVIFDQKINSISINGVVSDEYEREFVEMGYKKRKDSPRFLFEVLLSQYRNDTQESLLFILDAELDI